jgi:peptidoglycan/LPS O-acetylase OafA/YrhL
VTSRVRLGRLFWIGAAALLGAAALVAIAAVVRGDFSETDGKILALLGTALLAGGVALAGLALVERRDLAWLGRLTGAGSGARFAVLAAETVRDWDEGELTASCYLLLAVLLLVVTSRLLGSASPEWTFRLAVGLLAIGTVGAEAAIVGDAGSDSWAKPLATVWILAGLAWFLVPVVGRLTQRPPVERIVGRGPGRHEVELADGELLVVRRG